MSWVICLLPYNYLHLHNTMALIYITRYWQESGGSGNTFVVLHIEYHIYYRPSSQPDHYIALCVWGVFSFLGKHMSRQTTSKILQAPAQEYFWLQPISHPTTNEAELGNKLNFYTSKAMYCPSWSKLWPRLEICYSNPAKLTIESWFPYQSFHRSISFFLN